MRRNVAQQRRVYHKIAYTRSYEDADPENILIDETFSVVHVNANMDAAMRNIGIVLGVNKAQSRNDAEYANVRLAVFTSGINPLQRLSTEGLFIPDGDRGVKVWNGVEDYIKLPTDDRPYGLFRFGYGGMSEADYFKKSAYSIIKEAKAKVFIPFSETNTIRDKIEIPHGQQYLGIIPFIDSAIHQHVWVEGVISFELVGAE